MKTILLFACAALVCTTSCGSRNARKNTGAELTADSVTIYRMPQIPGMITDVESKMKWFAAHYWDNFKVADTMAVPRWSDYAEQAFVDMNYALAANNLPHEIGAETVRSLFTRAAVNKGAFMRLAEIAEKYLFDPNYPYRNEELYIVVLNSVLANPALDEWERIRPQEQLRLALKNRVGDVAADFRYTLASGATGTLHALKAPWTLLFFNNPGCPACRETMDQIGASPFLQNQIESGKLVVLAIHTDGDIEAWKEYIPQMPDRWIVSYDAPQTIKNNEVYDLKAIPTIYLLDSGKRVVLKDEMSIPRIEQTIYDNDTN
jgi:thiol-disulfide isomerase/thioredoxin